MGWLRELMRAGPPSLNSYDALARRVLDSPALGDRPLPRARSLSALLGKLDRGQELDWLAERPWMQEALATTLGCEVEVIARHARSALQTHDQQRHHLRLADVPRARLLELREEEPCPGIPPEVLTPLTWKRLWWHAPDGSGRTLAARWLSARHGLATVDGSGGGAPETPSSDLAFVELHTATDPLPSLPARVCVAAPFLPPDDGGFCIVASPKVEQFLAPLVRWVAARLPADGRFDAARALCWLSSHAHLIDGLGSALGLCGALDELGLEVTEGLSPERLVREVFRRRIERTSPSDDHWLSKHGFSALLAIYRRIVTDSDRRWDAPRGFDEWLELIPPEHQRGGDVDWMRLALAHSGSSLRSRELEDASKRLPPGAFKLIRALERAGFLIRLESGERLRLGPRWFGRAMLDEALRSLCAGSPAEWAEAVLQSQADLIAPVVLERARREPSALLDDVLEMDLDVSATCTAAVEMAFRCIGLAGALGVELPVDALAELWDEQLGRLVTLGGPIALPRIDFPPALGSREPLLSRGAFYLAALSVSEQLPRGSGGAEPVLRPWSLGSAPAELGGVYDRMHEDLGARRDLWIAASALVDRLRTLLGPVSASAPHPLELPGMVLDEVAHDVLEWETVRHLGRVPGLIAAVRDRAPARKLPWSSVAEALWLVWQSAGLPPEGDELFAADAEHAALLWPHLPPAIAVAAVRRAHEAGKTVDPSLLGRACWRALLAHGEAPFVGPESWRSAPADLVAEALGSDLRPEVLAVGWQRAPEAAERLTLRRLEERGPAAFALLRAAPPAATSGLVSGLENLPLGGDLTTGVRAWLHERVRQRAPGWMAAYGLLERLERDLALARRAAAPLARKGL